MITAVEGGGVSGRVGCYTGSDVELVEGPVDSHEGGLGTLSVVGYGGAEAAGGAPERSISLAFLFSTASFFFAASSFFSFLFFASVWR